jgi:hypothetical protein
MTLACTLAAVALALPLLDLMSDPWNVLFSCVQDNRKGEIGMNNETKKERLPRPASARREMDAVLTPEQQQKLDGRFESLRKLLGVAPEGNEP